ncbi:MAG: basic amino acid/polyamine antiporter [Flavobacteriaceae bacterium]
MGGSNQKLGLVGLVAIVFGSMIGGGLFNIPQNMAAEASLGAVLISWLITGIGMWFIVYSFKTLSDSRPDLNSGIYAYAREGFGRYVGFNSAWGYWISAALGNVAFAVMLNDSVGLFFPVLLEHSWATIIFCSILIWLMNFISALGMKDSSFINTISTFAKFIGIVIVITIMFIGFKVDVFNADFWGEAYNLEGLGSQIKSTMLVTLWCFIGVEGAVVISNRAKKSTDVGKATVLGFLAALLLYVLTSVLSFGIGTQPELAGLTDPSAGGVLDKVVGQWGAAFVNICVIVSVFGAWVAWTILVAEVPHDAAQQGVLPKFFLKENKNGAPISSLYISSLVMQLSVFMVVIATDVYLAMIDISGVMILPSYLLSMMYLFKGTNSKTLLANSKSRKNAMFVGLFASIYCIWLMFAADLSYLLLATIFYAIGIPFYNMAHKGEASPYTSREQFIKYILIGLALVSIYFIISGKITF